ncbi:MAG: phosphate ABC transporter substrate-binding protein PstS, partial [Synechococcaceae bacterium WB7_3xG_012]|nr:phosphate ABC transporter substrate-binding protein PstS [Synechococcaceae bacterium WB7_3xG_012]
FQDLAAKGEVKVNYQSVGSGAGIRQFEAATVDFAASDKPLSDEDAAGIKRGAVQVPMTAGAIAVAYNNPGCELKLTQQQLVGIFEGKITNYSDLGCSDQAIKVVYRSDGSGTTYNFTKSLSAFSPAWASGPGSGKSIKWPIGLGAKGNEGMAASLQQIKGALGYVESSYVRGDLQAAALQNAGGSYAKPTTKEAAEALGSIDLGPNLTGSNPNPKAGYPIVTFTWILLYKSGNGDKLKSLQQAFNYTLSDAAQANAPALGYVSLPANVLQKARAAVSSIGE